MDVTALLVDGQTKKDTWSASESEPLQVETEEICHVSKCVAVEPSEVLTTSFIENNGVPTEVAAKTSSPKQSAQPSENVAKDSSLTELETSPKYTVDHSSPSGIQDKRISKVLKKRHRLRPSVECNRVLRPRPQEKPKPPESSHDLVTASTETKREKKKKQRVLRNVTADEFLKIRKRLRYLQNKINYERSLIDAYSGEGWKGLSLEKLKPEKELQRATSEILRCKLKIRDLFQHLDSLCAEGRIPESLFDSEGEISSEDIFCAKCGFGDVSLENDIILCDGACERAFHQFCLEPPLLKEDIPPDDDGWLCPGCDCKVDCIDLLNESEGPNLLVTDSWEKVFPEAAATTSARQNLDHNFGLPSDDSDDDDYDPDGLGSNEKVQGDVTSSDESQCTTKSADLETPANEEQYLGLPSDDSEDDDYDPSALNHDENVKQESSSSDFTSDSEDLGAALDDGTSSGKDEGRRSTVGRKKKQFINEELSSLLKSDHREESSAPFSGKRHVERLDYKKLHDEAYGNVPTDSSDDEIWSAKDTYENVCSDSSDDEYWTNIAEPKGKNKTAKEVTSVSPNGNAPILKDVNDLNHDLIEPESTSKQRMRQKRKSVDTNGSPATPVKDSVMSGSNGKSARSSSTNRRLGEAATQGLNEVFKENQYPDKATKERLAVELELTPQQVSKWFNNSRWSFRHSSCTEACSTACTARKRVRTETNDRPPQTEPEMSTGGITSNQAENNATPETSTAAPERSGGDERDGKLLSPGSSRNDYRKRKDNMQTRRRKSTG